VSDFVLDASLALQWFLEDEENRKYSLAVLASLSEKRALVPLLWFYEVGNGLLMGTCGAKVASALTAEPVFLSISLCLSFWHHLRRTVVPCSEVIPHAWLTQIGNLDSSRRVDGFPALQARSRSQRQAPAAV
jgi:hypothetical protein